MGVGAKAKSGTLKLGILLCAAVAMFAMPASSAVAAVPSLLGQAPEDGQAGSAAGRMSLVTGIAADPNLPGHVYVADRANNRIDVFTPWGEFVKAFGWKVNAEQPEEKLQTCIAATGCQAGTEGSGAGQLTRPAAVAVGPEGDVYVVEGVRISSFAENSFGGDIGNHRVQKFSPAGEFIYATGYDTIAHGPDDSTNNETQQLSVAASKGTFKLKFENPLTGGGTQETSALPFNASATEVKAALGALSTIGGLGGSVSVTGGLGDPTGSTPYTITFESNLGGDDVPQLSMDRTSLGAASIGGTLRCSTSSEIEEKSETIEYRWLRNGVEIPGAESPTYTTIATDEGKSVQCEVTAKSAQSAAMQAANPVYVAPPEGVVAPPVAPGPGSLTAQVELLIKEENGAQRGNEVGGPGGGARMICEKGSWSGANTFAYRWFRNGVLIPGATESTYTVTEADLATPAYFQCAVTASNAGPATTTKFSEASNVSPPTTFPAPAPALFQVPVNMEPPSSVSTAHQGGAVEVCGSADTCKAGIKGTGQGQFGAIEENAYPGNLAISPTDGTVFVGEGQHERIQIFHSDGTFGEEIAMPLKEEPNDLRDFTDLTVDSAGNLHVILVKPHGLTQPQQSVREIRELAPHGPSAEFFGPAIKREEELTGLAVDTAGNSYSKSSVRVANIEKEDPERGVLEFDPAGECLDCGTEGEGGKPGFDRTSDRHDPKVIVGIAAGGACEATDIYVLSTRNPFKGTLDAYFNIWGPPPNTALCPPPPVPPRIDAQWASSVDSVGVELHAKINPEFWTDTRYYVEYGTSPCFEGGCTAKPAAPGSLLSHKAAKAPLKTAAISLEGLEPGTTYHYRFVANSSGGGPVVGLSGKSGAQAEGTFTTFTKAAFPPCENDPFRIGPAALLPDCRAYEMVSPLNKESGDVKVLGEFTTGLPAVLEQSSTSGERLAYGTYRAFGDASSAPWTTQYVAARGEDGWRSHAISPAQLGQIDAVTKRIDTELKLFSPDLCEAWLEGTSELLLTEDAVPDAFNLYRRTDEECGGPAYEALTTVPEPHSFSGLELQGVSADGQAAIYAVSDSLATASPEPPAQDKCQKSGASCNLQLYYRRAGGELHYVCVLPDGSAISKGGCSAGIAQDQSDFYRTASVHHALSADGSRVFWTAKPFGEAPIYLRENPGEDESAHLLGTATGTGNLIGTAAGTGKLINGSVNISNVKETKGHFAVGQAISGAGIKPETTILEKTEPSPGVFKLKMSQAASASGEGVEVKGEGSATVSGLTTTSGAFAVGQEVSVADGSLPPATIVACAPSCGPSATSLTLSTKASGTGTAVALSATSECTEAEKGCTLAVSAEAESASGASASRFWAAAEDGSRAIFSTSIGGGSSDLYEFDAAEAEDHLIARGLLGVAGASADAKWLYFASGEALVSEPNAQGLSPVKDQPNLYLFHEGEYRFIATLASKDVDVSSAFAVTGAQRFNTTHVSSDGLHVAFMSQATPTGYDNLDANNGRADAEVYLYDASADEGEGKLLCASCNPSRARPVGVELRTHEGLNQTDFWAAAHLPLWENTLYQPRALSEEGTRLYFESNDALTPRDTNGVGDVYQWEAPRSGGCEEGFPGYSALNEGCVNLISSGQSPRGSEFIDAGPDGHDVFFLTLSSLLPQDYGLIDIYDARVQGGFPQPPAPPPACEGEACQGSPEAPNDPTPASESFEGAGNVPEEPVTRQPKPCAKGKVKRHGKCVAKRKSHKRAKRQRRTAR